MVVRQTWGELGTGTDTVGQGGLGQGPVPAKSLNFACGDRHCYLYHGVFGSGEIMWAKGLVHGKGP